MRIPVETCLYLRGIRSARIFGPESERSEWWAGDCWSGGASASTWEWRAFAPRSSFFSSPPSLINWGARRGRFGWGGFFFLVGGGWGGRGGGWGRGARGGHNAWIPQKE